MTSEGIRKARVVLRSLGKINKRFKEQQLARASLQRHLDAVNQKPTAQNLIKLNKAVESTIEKEKAMASSSLIESQKVIQLRKALASLSANYTHLQDELGSMDKKLVDYTKLKKSREQREKVLENKVSFTNNQKKRELGRRLTKLEESLGNSKNKKIREKIASLKKQI